MKFDITKKTIAYKGGHLIFRNVKVQCSRSQVQRVSTMSEPYTLHQTKYTGFGKQD